MTENIKFKRKISPPPRRKMWFSKKRDDVLLTAHQEELARLNINLKHSFLKIKEDIRAIRAWIDYFETQHREHKSKFKHVENRLAQMDELVSYAVLTPQKQTKENVMLQQEVKEMLEQTSSSHYLKLLEGLTETQKVMFHRLALLLKEAGQEWITIKSLATDLYPNKTYDQIRSMMSEYVNILVESGLLEKRRRGKQAYVTVTNKGKQLLEKVKQEVAPKIKTKGKNKA